MGVKRVDTNKGDKEKPEYRCRLVAKEINQDKQEDFARGDPATGGQKSVVLDGCELAQIMFGFHRRREGLPPREGQEESVCGFAEGGSPRWDAREAQEGDVCDERRRTEL